MTHMSKDIIRQFEDWGNDQLVNKALCAVQRQKDRNTKTETCCYPDISDDACRACFDADRKGEAYAR